MVPCCLQMDRDLEGALARAERLAQRAQQRAEEAGRLAQQQAGGDGWQTYSRENSYEHRSGGEQVGRPGCVCGWGCVFSSRNRRACLPITNIKSRSSEGGCEGRRGSALVG